MLVSVLLIVLGFVLMSGGAPTDGVSFNPELFSTRRIVIAPIVCVAGFSLMAYAIMAKPSSDSSRKNTERPE
ncbi:hypothetical protein PORCRE_583 [Porphyromonas crevioricanis JCM 15906]|nr:hypothetical protein PORCRE_583 [Porphyromonas crevioricanis JCM 15906]